jgi:hypothetical protein
VGSPQGKSKQRCCARARRPRARLCFRKGCGRKYLPRCWNQRFCQDPECQREVRRWQAARRQAKRRLAAEVKARHAEAQRARRQRAKAASQTAAPPEVTVARGHAAKSFFSTPVCDRPGCFEPPVNSIRNPARYCCAACRQAVRNVLDRERKWQSRSTLEGRLKRSFEYQAARQQRSRQPRDASGCAPPRGTPQ